jgi:hypothetical protein
MDYRVLFTRDYFMVSLSARRVIVLMASLLILHERYGDEILRSEIFS